MRLSLFVPPASRRRFCLLLFVQLASGRRFCLSFLAPPLAPIILNAVKDLLLPFVPPVYPEERRAPTSYSAFHRLTRRHTSSSVGFSLS
jgi:hypothetical protein